MPRLTARLYWFIRGRPPRGKWTLARRLLQLAILTLFTIQFGFMVRIPFCNVTLTYPPGLIIKGSLASSIILDQQIPVIGRIQLLDVFAWLEQAVATRAPTLASLTAVAVIAVLYLVLLGRFFCGWVCPVDMIFSLLERKLNRPQLGGYYKPHLPTRAERIVPVASILAFLAASAVLAYPVFTSISPIAAVTKLTSLSVALVYGIPGVTLGLLEALGVMVLVAVATNLVGEYVFRVKRLWCRFVCPVGNLYGLIANRYAPLRVKVVNKDACVKCNLCGMVCPMSIDVTSYVQSGRDVTDHRCFKCGRCTEVCPRNVIKLGFRVKPGR